MTAQYLANAANRALGSVINKYKHINGLEYYTYNRLFQSGVCPILDYCSEVWGYQKLSKIDAIQNKTIRIFWGVHKFVSIDAINGDMGWTSSWERRKINMVRFWNILMPLNNTRLPKVILNWDSKCRGNTWSLNIQGIFNKIDHENLQVSFFMKYSVINGQWILQENLNYVHMSFLKIHMKSNPMLSSFMNRKHRSYLAQYRCGILQLEMETGRWQNKTVEEKICKVCESSEVENEFHFIFSCTLYNNIRATFV